MKLKSTLCILLCSFIPFTYVKAVAPVYDADNYPPTIEGSNDSDANTPSESKTEEYAPAPSSVQQRVQRIEQQVSHLSQTDSSERINQLQSEVQTLRGQVEELTHQVKQLQTDQTKITQPVKLVPAKIIKQTDADTEDKSEEISENSGNSQPNVAEEQQIYQTAYNYIKEKKYNEAVVAFQTMLRKYPTGQFAANAHYWLGELYGLMNKNDQSAAEFESVVKNYPDSPKISDAMLKLGLVYVAESKWSDAKSTFKKVVSKYPGSSSAHIAAEQLKQIKQAGN